MSVIPKVRMGGLKEISVLDGRCIYTVVDSTTSLLMNSTRHWNWKLGDELTLQKTLSPN